MKVVADATAVMAAISGSGDIDISGKAAEFDAVVTGSGDIDAALLNATQAKANITGSGDIKIHAKNLLTVKIVGSGDVMVNKDVATVNKKVIGSGEVSKY
jgi:Flp pilus assembly secretin CpaC